MADQTGNRPAQAPREFIPVEDPQEARRLLWDGARNLSSAFIWSRDQKHTLETNLNVVSEAEKTLYFWLPPDFDIASFEDALATAEHKDECFFSLSLPTANVFFRSTYQGRDAGGLKFSIPSALFKVQRRTSLRFTIPDGHILKIDFQDPVLPESVLTRKAIDISDGGLAIVVSAEDQPLFQVGLVLTGVSFTLNQRKITCEAEVRHVRELPPEFRLRGFKVGLQFRDLSKADKEWIASYVADESRRFYSRFI